MIQGFVEIILFFVMFFGLAFILNMLLRRTWLMSVLYIFIMIIMIDGISTFEYFINPKEAFATAWMRLISIGLFDYIVFLSGFIGTVVSGFVIRYLRKSGYQMF